MARSRRELGVLSRASTHARSLSLDLMLAADEHGLGPLHQLPSDDAVRELVKLGFMSLLTRPHGTLYVIRGFRRFMSAGAAEQVLVPRRRA